MSNIIQHTLRSLARRLLILFTRPLEQFRNIRVFRFGIPWLVKITPRTTSTEAHALHFLHSSGLDLPIPRLTTSFVHLGITYTIMTRLPGVRLIDAMEQESFTDQDLETIVAEVSDVLVKLQTLRQPPVFAGQVMISASGHDLPEPISFFELRYGPLPSVLELWRYTASFADIDEMLEHGISQSQLDILDADPIRFVHPDLRTYNILVKDGHLTGIIDWEDAGWYPSAWQVHAMRFRRFGCQGKWLEYWKERHRFAEEAEGAFEVSMTFLVHSPV
ncbi:kinase-like protein [Peniophora sp. CONT]|nr:kinase-like protein [Peniophora sp. CONT]